MFTPQAGGGTETTTFYGVHRALYAAFRGVPINECVGGGCSFYQSATPTRFALPALNEVEVRFAEVGDKWDGFTEVTTVRNKTNGDVFGSLIVGHPRFKTEVWVTDPKTDQKLSTSIYELWFGKAKAPGKGFILGESGAADNAQSLTSVRRSFSYQFGQNAGHSSEIEHLPENQSVVDRIVGRSPPDQYHYGERNQMIFDAVLPSANKLTVLKEVKASEVSGVIQGYSPEEKIAFLRRSRAFDSGQRLKYLRYVRDMLKDSELGVRREAALWSCESEQNRDLASEILQAAISDTNFRGEGLDRLGRAIVGLKVKGLLLPQLRARVADIDDLGLRLQVLQATEATNHEMLENLEPLTRPEASLGRRRALLDLLSTRDVFKDKRAQLKLLSPLLHDPDLRIRREASLRALNSVDDRVASDDQNKEVYLAALDAYLRTPTAADPDAVKLRSLNQSMEGMLFGREKVHTAAMKAIFEDPVEFKRILAAVEADQNREGEPLPRNSEGLLRALLGTKPKLVDAQQFAVTFLRSEYGPDVARYLHDIGTVDPIVVKGFGDLLASAPDPWTPLWFLSRRKIEDPAITNRVLEILRGGYAHHVYEAAMNYFVKSAPGDNRAFEAIASNLERHAGYLTLMANEPGTEGYDLLYEGAGKHRYHLDRKTLESMLREEVAALVAAEALSPAALKSIQTAKRNRYIKDYIDVGRFVFKQDRKIALEVAPVQAAVRLETPAPVSGLCRLWSSVSGPKN